MTTKQLGYWQGEFGDAYIDRNDGEMHARRPPFFRALLAHADAIKSVCEVGCNVAWNLKILHDLRPHLEIHGIEPNERALSIARSRYPNFDLRRSTAFELPFGDATIDLVMTVNVLIHIAPADLTRALAEIRRVAKSWILAVEYFSEEPVVVPYRGLQDALFKRDWCTAWLDFDPALRLAWTGSLDRDAGFDDCRFWLFQIPSPQLPEIGSK